MCCAMGEVEEIKNKDKSSLTCTCTVKDFVFYYNCEVLAFWDVQRRVSPCGGRFYQLQDDFFENFVRADKSRIV